MYFNGRCPAAVIDYLKNNPALILVCPDALILNKVGSAVKHWNENLLVHTYLDEATAQNFTYLLLRTWKKHTTASISHTTHHRQL